MIKLDLKLENRQKYFYAKQASELYDDTIELVCPYYSVAHHMLVDLVRNFFTANSFKNSTKKNWILDVGAGTGAESIPLMQEFPNVNVVAVDFTSEMRKVFEKNFNQEVGTAAKEVRYKYLTSDFMSSELTPDFLKNLISPPSEKNQYSIVVSAYTIHHYDLEDKKKFYQKIFNVLKQGGVFINIDLFNYDSPMLSKIAHENDIEWIKAQFKNPSSQFKNAPNIPEKERKVLSKAWVNHYTYDNILHPVSTQLSLLKDVGFSEVANPFIYYQNGLIWARK
jgi:tRNA (cmo5U34)-methyltransferase